MGVESLVVGLVTRVVLGVAFAGIWVQAARTTEMAAVDVAGYRI
jgi:hypothetical protein